MEYRRGVYFTMEFHLIPQHHLYFDTCELVISCMCALVCKETPQELCLALNVVGELQEQDECTSGCMSEVLRTLPAWLWRCSCPLGKDEQIDILLTAQPICMYYTPTESYDIGECEKEIKREAGHI